MRCMNSYTLNKNVFSLFLNVVSVMSDARSAAERLFHTRGPWTCGCRSLFWCMEQSVGRSEWVDRRRRVATVDVGSQYVWRYCGAMSCRHLQTRTAVLNVIRRRTGSQWRSRRIGIICSDLLTPVTRRAAAFWMTWSLFSNWLLTPTSRLLQLSSRFLAKACTRVFVASGISDCLIALSRRWWKRQDRLSAAIWCN